MSFSAPAVARVLRTLFPLTIRGVLMLALAAGLLVAGVARADLTGLFWGSSFLLFTLYALLAGHLFLLSTRRRRTAKSVSFHLPTGGLFPGEETEAVIAARLPRSLPPGFSVQLALPLSWHERRIQGVRLRLRPAASQTRVSFHAAHRGVYEAAGAVLEACDVLGLTAHRLFLPCQVKLTVYPRVRSARELMGVVEQTDEATFDSHRRRRSEELLEVRKYYPGDDVRRLNWKVFAHLDQLFLRIGEEVPPPESRILFILDTTSNGLVPRAVEADYLDALVESCASVMAHLAGRGREVALSRPGLRDCRSFGEGSLAVLLAALAEAWWTTEAWAPELPSKALQAVIFSSPGSPGLPRIMSTVKGRGWSASLFLQDLGPEGAVPARRIRDFIFLPGGARTSSRGAIPRKRERSEFSDALERDMAFYAGSVKRMGHAAEI